MKTKENTITKEQCKDSGLALVLIYLLCYQAWKLPFLMILAIIFLLISMTYPPIFKPFARFWFALSTALGTVVSKIILSVLFFAVLMPIGLARKVMGKDPMRINCWKNGEESVFRVREHRFEPKDLENPY